MNYYKSFSDKAIKYLDRVKKAGIENKQELDEISRQAYSEYREGKLSEKESFNIFFILKLQFPDIGFKNQI